MAPDIDRAQERDLRALPRFRFDPSLMGKSSQQMGPTREALIASGMIYSPRPGYAAFTVPLFDAS